EHALPQQPVTIAIEVENHGESEATGVRVVAVSSDLTGGTVPPDSGWTCGPSLGLLNCVLDDPLAAGASVSLTVTATVGVTPADPVVANFSVSANEPESETSDNTAVVS